MCLDPRYKTSPHVTHDHCDIVLLTDMTYHVGYFSHYPKNTLLYFTLSKKRINKLHFIKNIFDIPTGINLDK